MFIWNLFTTDDRVKHNIERIHKDRAEPELNILMLTYRYIRCPIALGEILAMAKKYDFDNHYYLGLTVSKNKDGSFVVTD